MAATVISATARTIEIGRIIGGQFPITDGTGQLIGKAELVRGFAHYYGVRGGAHQGFTCVIRDGLEGLRRALAGGVRNGRDDRR